MPTGYTADVESGAVTDFATFALRCARAFGACVGQREDPLDVLPKMREVAPYYVTSLAQARERVAKVEKMTLIEADLEAQAQYEHEASRAAEHRVDTDAEQARYRDMLAHVEAWVPPSSEHRPLKDFMREQLTISMRSPFYWPAPKRIAAAEWLMRERTDAYRAVAERTKSLREEDERVANANAWIAALHESLAGSTALPQEPKK